MALPHGVMGLSAFVIVVFPDHTHLLFSNTGIKDCHHLTPETSNDPLTHSVTPGRVNPHYIPWEGSVTSKMFSSFLSPRTQYSFTYPYSPLHPPILHLFSCTIALLDKDRCLLHQVQSPNEVSPRLSWSLFLVPSF